MFMRRSIIQIPSSYETVRIFMDRVCGQLPYAIMKTGFMSVLWRMIPTRLICIPQRKYLAHGKSS